MKVKAQDLTGLALVWAVAMNSGFREVSFAFGYHDPAKAKVPTQVMVSEKKGSCYWFCLGGDWLLNTITAVGLSLGETKQKDWVAFKYGDDGHLTGLHFNGETPIEAVARFYLHLKGVKAVKLPKELEALPSEAPQGSSYPPENEHGY